MQPFLRKHFIQNFFESRNQKSKQYNPKNIEQHMGIRKQVFRTCLWKTPVDERCKLMNENEAENDRCDVENEVK